MKDINSKELFKVISLPVVVASLCCLAPVMLVLLGLSTVSFAASLTNTLYDGYGWVFRLVGLVLLAISVAVYFRQKKGICTLNEAKQRRNEIINIALAALIAAIVGYIFWLYVVVELIGLLLGVWG